jgi:hypothetical protein
LNNYHLEGQWHNKKGLCFSGKKKFIGKKGENYAVKMDHNSGGGIMLGAVLGFHGHGPAPYLPE